MLHQLSTLKKKNKNESRKIGVNVIIKLKNMFDIDSKIKANQERLKLDLNHIRNIQNAYGYIVIYISFIGITFFDFIDYTKTLYIDYLSTQEKTFIFFITISIILIGITLIYFTKLFLPKPIAHEEIPEFVYKDVYNKIKKWIEENNLKKNIEIEVKEAYLEHLEDAVKSNFNIYQKKRSQLRMTIKFALLSLVPYFLSMLLFHLK